MPIIDLVICKTMTDEDFIKDIIILGAYLRDDPTKINETANAVFLNAEEIVSANKNNFFEVIEIPLNTLIVDHINQ